MGGWEVESNTLAEPIELFIIQTDQLLGRMNTSRTGITLAALPSVLMITLFYSLAIHMRLALGGWPTSIGERGFPPALAIHSAVTTMVFLGFFASLLVWPVLMFTCLLVKPWRRLAVYLAVYAGAILVCYALTLFATPERFLYWWRD